MARRYDESDIDYHSGLAGIRAKASMYLGPMDSDGLYTCWREVADNVGDENAAGRNSFMGTSVSTDGEFWVWDEGEGIPVGNKKIVEHGVSTSISTLTLLLTRTHAGGKFRDASGAYAESSGTRGTHGVGLKAVNAVAQCFEVWTCRSNVWYYTRFEKGEEVVAVSKCKAPKIVGKTLKKGTLVHFVPDLDLFQSDSALDLTHIHNWANISSFMQPKFFIVVHDGEVTEYYAENGVSAYLDDRVVALDTEGLGATCCTSISIGDVADLQGLTDDELVGVVDVALAFTPVEGTHVDFYTNGVYNREGGKHADEMWKALGRALLEHGNSKTSCTPADLREGVVGIINYKLPKPQFSGQTKEKLSDVRVSKPAARIFYQLFSTFFNKNKSLAKLLLNRASSIRKLKDEESAKRKSLLGIKLTARESSKGVLPGKLAGCNPKTKPMERELYLVEGDSAGGSAKQARYKEYQAVLPLKGKPLNAYKHPDSKVIGSVEIANILTSLGYDPKHKDPISALQYGKIILLSDSDVDGYHINSLECALFNLYLPEMFDRGMIYALDSSGCKFYCRGKKKDYYFGSSVDAVLANVKKNKDTVFGKVSYLKGWGELDPEGLREAAMNPDTRTLIKLQRNKKEMRRFEMIMGEDVNYRKQLLGVL